MKEFTVVIIIFVLAIFALGFFGYSIESYGCSVYGETTDREVKYNISGCFVKHNDQWYEQKEYKFIALQSK